MVRLSNFLTPARVAGRFACVAGPRVGHRSGFRLSREATKKRPALRRAGAFTLIELLTVVAIIGILAAILIPVTALVREQARRSVCQSNIRQQLLAFFLYTEDHNEESYWRMHPTDPIGADNAPESIYPHYVDDLDLFICPSTRNVIRRDAIDRREGTLVDLRTNAAHREDATGGHSYEYFGAFQRGEGDFAGHGVIKNPSTVYPLETHIVLIVDGDDWGINNCPGEMNNHGSAGWNWGFADGHVEWVTREQTAQKLWDSYMTSGTDCPPGYTP